MSTNFQITPQQLHPTGETIVKYHVDSLGIKRARFKIDASPVDGHRYKFPLHYLQENKVKKCIELSERCYHQGLNGFVLYCITNAIPVEVYVAMPVPQRENRAYREDLKTASGVGVGVYEVDGQDVRLVQKAIPLSLISANRINTKSFPASLRADLQAAQDTFFKTDPAQGCSALYNEIESYTRKIVEKAVNDGLIPVPGFNIRTYGWANVLNHLNQHRARISRSCPNLTAAMVSRLITLPPHRNSFNHKPRTYNDRAERDAQIRTRWDDCHALFLETIQAVKPLRVH